MVTCEEVGILGSSKGTTGTPSPHKQNVVSTHEQPTSPVAEATTSPLASDVSAMAMPNPSEGPTLPASSGYGTDDEVKHGSNLGASKSPIKTFVVGVISFDADASSTSERITSAYHLTILAFTNHASNRGCFAK